MLISVVLSTSGTTTDYADTSAIEAQLALVAGVGQSNVAVHVSVGASAGKVVLTATVRVPMQSATSAAPPLVITPLRLRPCAPTVQHRAPSPQPQAPNLQPCAPSLQPGAPSLQPFAPSQQPYAAQAWRQLSRVRC